MKYPRINSTVFLFLLSASKLIATFSTSEVPAEHLLAHRRIEQKMWQLPMKNNIDGIGGSVAASYDGGIVAIGAPYANDTGDGEVTVYRLDLVSNSWEVFGSKIIGEGGIFLGFSVDLSHDGKILAVGSRFGGVKIFRYMEDISDWKLRGTAIVASNDDEEFGRTVRLSSSGNIASIGAIGYAQVYKFMWQQSLWEQVGQTINGTENGDLTGRSISFASSGKVLAVGASRRDGTDSANNVIEDTGSVTVYNLLNGQWSEGMTFMGDEVKERAGFSHAISDHGLIIAIGSPNFDCPTSGPNDCGRVRIFQKDTTTKTWNQLGGDIVGKSINNIKGFALDLSGDGQSLIVASSDAVAMYTFDEGTSEWIERVLSTGSIALSPFAVTLSGDATTALIAEKGEDTSNSDTVNVMKEFPSPSPPTLPPSQRCQDDKTFSFEYNGSRRKCFFISNQIRKDRLCNKTKEGSLVSDKCKASCHTCDVGDNSGVNNGSNSGGKAKGKGKGSFKGKGKSKSKGKGSVTAKTHKGKSKGESKGKGKGSVRRRRQ